MTILIGALISILTEVFKWSSNKLGKKLSKGIILLIVFVLALAYAWGSADGYWSEFFKQWVVTLSVAIAWYEIAYKKVLLPVFRN